MTQRLARCGYGTFSFGPAGEFVAVVACRSSNVIGRTPMSRLVAIVIFVLGVPLPLLVAICLLVGLE